MRCSKLAEETRVSYSRAQHAMVTDLFMAHSMRSGRQ